jgi:hypothetical protein
MMLKSLGKYEGCRWLSGPGDTGQTVSGPGSAAFDPAAAVTPAPSFLSTAQKVVDTVEFASINAGTSIRETTVALLFPVAYRLGRRIRWGLDDHGIRLPVEMRSES